MLSSIFNVTLSFYTSGERKRERKIVYNEGRRRNSKKGEQKEGGF